MADTIYDIPETWNLTPEVRTYIAAIEPKQRPAFHRIVRLIFEVYPDARGSIAYNMPTFVVGEQGRGARRLHVGAWKGWVSLYGWQSGRDGGFAARHPELVSGNGTLKIKPAQAGGLEDGELRGMIEACLRPGE